MTLETWSSTVAESTAQTARGAIKRFEKWRAGRVTDGAMLQEYRAYLARALKPSVANLHMSHLGAHWKREKMAGQPAPDPSTVAQCFKRLKVDKHAPVVLSREQAQALWKACELNETGRLVRVLMLTGCRREEATQLRPDSVRHNALVIRDFKRKREREFPLAILGGWPIEPPYTYDWREWGAIREAAGLPGLKCKSLRSTLATYMISSGGIFTPYVAASLVGHSIAVATARYWGSPVFGLAGLESALDWYGITQGAA